MSEFLIVSSEYVCLIHRIASTFPLSRRRFITKPDFVEGSRVSKSISQKNDLNCSGIFFGNFILKLYHLFHNNIQFYADLMRETQSEQTI